jgi:predicted pyridoxine 5'-phosphate oxidase superfamily flavin-nucleotide-binding protein
MSERVSDVVFSPAVKAAQERLGSRATYARRDEQGGWQTWVTADLAAFVGQRDSFYLATASLAGQPYIQHRGGPKGFLRVLDERRLAFADFKGNRQYVTIGNLSENDQVCLFLMDYPGRRRVKIWGRARVVEDDPDLLESLAMPGGAGRSERAIVIDVSIWDINCPQHIARRYGEDDVALAVAKLTARIEELEAELATVKAANAEG